MLSPTLRLATIVAAAGLVATGCALLRSVPPEATDPAITVRAGDHLVAVPLVPDLHNGQLVVFFPGTGATPDDYETLLRRVAGNGYLSVALDYENSQSINFEVCRGQGPSCPEKARLEILTGAESPWIEPDVHPVDSAFNRLAELIDHQATAHPEEGWNTFLGAGGIRWDHIVVAGHSQGGGMAAMTAKLHRVARVVLFGATEPAAWTLAAFATPEDRFWGLVHDEEPIRDPILRSWENLGLPGQTVLITTEAPPADAHRIITIAQGCGGEPDTVGRYHSCYVVDRFLPPPADDGAPAFAAVWDHLFTAPA